MRQKLQALPIGFCPGSLGWSWCASSWWSCSCRGASIYPSTETLTKGGYSQDTSPFFAAELLFSFLSDVYGPLNIVAYFFAPIAKAENNRRAAEAPFYFLTKRDTAVMAVFPGEHLFSHLRSP
jgi:hypothetical protein